MPVFPGNGARTVGGGSFGSFGGFGGFGGLPKLLLPSWFEEDSKSLLLRFDLLRKNKEEDEYDNDLASQ